MNQSLQNILNIIHQSEHLSEEEKNALIKAVKDTDKEIAITEFKLDRTEKVKRTTAILLEETIAELEQKRKAVEEQNKELEIEAALEKVRSRSLAMHSSDEMQAVVNTVIDQLQKLNIVLDTTNILIFNKQKKFIEFWTGSNSTGDQLTTGWRVPYFNISYYKAIHQAHENGKEIFTGNYSFTEKNKLFKHLFANTDFSKPES